MARTLNLPANLFPVRVLAGNYFAGPILAPLPAAISATLHSILGRLLATFWRLQPGRPCPTSPTF